MVVLFFVLFVFVVVLFCFVLFVFLVLFGFLFLFFLLAALGQFDGLRKGPLSLSFAAFSSDGVACFSQFISGKYKLVERPGESHEGVGRKKKKPCWPPAPLDSYRSFQPREHEL